MIAEIRNLNPKPGLAFGSTMVQPIVPDVYVRPGPDGGFIVELNSDTLPKILVNQRYHAELSKNARADGAKTYLAENLQSATWLMRALDQRAKTILKVATEIATQILSANQGVVCQLKKLYDLTTRATLGDAIKIEQEFFRAYNSSANLNDLESRRAAVMERRIRGLLLARAGSR